MQIIETYEPDEDLKKKGKYGKEFSIHWFGAFGEFIPKQPNF